MYDLLLILVVALVTLLTRVLPFLVFKDKNYPVIEFLGEVLPYSIMAMLVVYCLKSVDIFTGTHGLSEIIGVSSVILLHLYKKNTLVSIFGGTIIYMLCVQVFIGG